MADLICGRHQYNGMFVGKVCPLCEIEEETKTTPADKIADLTAEVAGMRKALTELAGICGIRTVGWSIARRALGEEDGDG